jgi:predicted neuraminidase
MVLTALAVMGSMSAAVVQSELIFEKAPFLSCHASTIEWAEGGLVAAWFGGTAEGENDVGIWLSRKEDGQWSAPREVARDERHPCWNPVLFERADGVLQLYYKAGPSPREWWGVLIESTDAGATWSPPQRLPGELLGPIKNKPVALGGGVVLSGSSTEHAGWRVHMERSADGARTWTKGDPLNDGTEIGAIQPTVLPHAGGQVQILCRTRQGRIAESWSKDQGLTWSPMTLTTLPNPNAGIDGVALNDGRVLLVYNRATSGRENLSVAVSPDGKEWQEAVLVLENQPGEYSYPAVIQTPDGMVHVTYTYRRRHIKHVVIDPREIDWRHGSEWTAPTRSTPP